MKKIRLVSGSCTSELETKANEVLDTIDSNNVDIKYMLDQKTIVIEYEVEKVKLMCVDCQFYDTTQSIKKAFGLCQCHGERVRFSHEACDQFCDIRE